MHEIVITGYGIKAPGVFNKLDFLSVLKNGICTQSVTKSPNGEEMVAGVIEGDFLEINQKNYKRTHVQRDSQWQQHWTLLKCQTQKIINLNGLLYIGFGSRGNS